ncbi:hypothetical protein N9L28_02640 [Luminiphilus sp.]|nr:hypothetical protein [Luminiphilus sp.]
MKNCRLSIACLAAGCCGLLMAEPSFALEEDSNLQSSGLAEQASQVVVEEAGPKNLADYPEKDQETSATEQAADFVPTFDSIFSLKTKARHQREQSGDGGAGDEALEKSEAQ